MPPFTFFKNQTEVRREHAKQFLRYLRKQGDKICLPVMKFFHVMRKFLEKVKRNRGYLEHQLGYQS